MKTLKNTLLILPFFLMFCGDSQESQSTNWLNTDVQTMEGLKVPSHILAACESNGHIKISWEAFATTATDLVIERKLTEGDFEKVGEVSADELFFSDTVTNGILYTYRVRAVIMSGDEINFVSAQYSDSASATAANICPIIDDVPFEETEVPIGFEPA